MKKFIIFCIGIFTVLSAYAAQIVNVEYIHNAIQDKWDISLAYNSELSEPRVAANMKYLLTAVDVANQVINGAAITDYGNGEYATMVAADTVATDGAIADLIQKKYYFDIITTSDTASFSFNISAQGKFLVDWGDGVAETIVRTDVTDTTYSHTYDVAGTYTVRLGGRATDYNDTDTGYSAVAAISFANNTNVYQISGSLGRIFPTLDDGTNPNFFATFQKNTNLQSIPETLFDGIASPGKWMFGYTFDQASKITEIPVNLFANIKGTPKQTLFYRTFAHVPISEVPEQLFSGISGDVSSAANMFGATFAGCTKLKTFPAGLFANLTGRPAISLFESFCQNCTGLEELPAELFTSLSGTPQYRPFGAAFNGCSNLKTLGAPLFGDLSTGTICAWCNPFGDMFSACYALEGDSAKMRLSDGSIVFLYEGVTSYTDDQNTYLYDTGLADYESIPDTWK